MPSYLLLIRLLDTDSPTITRILSVPSTLNFVQLHVVLQIAFGWQAAHAWKFTVKGSPVALDHDPFHDPEYLYYELAYGRRGMFEEELMNLNDWPDPSNKLEFNAADTKLSHAFGKPEWCSKGVRAIYTYDFGDGWEHEITFLGVSDANLVKAFSAAMPPSKLPKRPFLLCITGEVGFRIRLFRCL